MTGCRRAALPLALVVATVVAQGAAAALAPNYERLRELETVLGSSDLARVLGSRVVDGIDAQALHTYVIRAGTCTVVVTLVTAPNAPAMPGPWQFTIQVGALQCR